MGQPFAGLLTQLFGLDDEYTYKVGPEPIVISGVTTLINGRI